MKKTIITVLIIALSFSCKTMVAQGVTVTDDPSYTKDPSAILDVMSTSKGLLPPRLTTEQRDNIIAPVEGLIVFNISSNTLDLYNGASWGSPTGEFICGSSQVADGEGKYYSTVQIGSQCWMTKNLNVGTRINGTNNQTDNSTIEKYCYNDEEDSCTIYGALYQWNEMMQYVTSDSTQGICPENWHIPSDAEWSTLEMRIDPTVSSSATGWRGTDGGSKLKQGGSSGFEALLAGQNISGGSFDTFGTGGYFWTSSEGSSGAWERYVYNSNTQIARYDQNKSYGLSIRCIYDEYTLELPSVTTGEASDVGGNDADVSGEITNIGVEEAMITHYGHCWSTTPAPTINDTCTDLGSTNILNTFSSHLSNLEELTTYFVRAYAENNEGLTYGTEISFSTVSATTCPGIPTVTYGGQVYNTVQIGNQCWLKENLNIGNQINSNTAQSDNGVIEKYCYNNQSSNCDIYGGFYKWSEAMQYVTTEGSQGVCPSGWHIPTDAEWCTLENEVDAGTISCSETGYRGIDAGSNLKEAGTSHWASGNTGTNSSDFTALPGGYFSNFNGGPYYLLGTGTSMWSSTEGNPNTAWRRMLYYTKEGVDRGMASIFNQAYSIRCIKD